MRQLFSVALIVVVVCLNAQCDRARPTAPAPVISDKERIQGTWQLVSGERHGEEFSDELVKNVSLIFAGELLKTKNGSEVTEAKFALHPHSNPKGIDLDMDGSPGLGIYQLDGETLKILHGEIEQPRPAGFDAVKNGDLTLLVLRKQTE
jgi:uncharacterized protein (TIGR03067 family)